MGEIRVVIIYTGEILSVQVNGDTIDTDCIQNKSIEEWFEPSTGRDGWKGLIQEVQRRVGDSNLSFEFSGAQEHKTIFEKCLGKRGFACSTEGLSQEEVAKRYLEEAEKAELRRLWEDAFEKYKEAAEYGDSIKAQYKVGAIYYKVSKGELSVSGIDVESSLGKAIQYLEKAAKTDNANAKYYLYKALLDIPGNQNEEEAMKWLKEAAQLGLAEAQGELGVCCQTGRGIEKNLEKAVYWFQKAADQNDAFSQNRLGNRYLLGEGVSKDLEKAFQWFQRAAEGGFVKAYVSLANCYKDGLGTKKDLGAAEQYLRKYTEKSMENKEEFLTTFYSCGKIWAALVRSGAFSDEKKEELLKIAFQCFEVSAKKAKDSKGMYELAQCYEYGRGIEKNENEAIYWYQKAAENGNAEGAFELGNCYYRGKGTYLDLEEAVRWYQVAIDKNYLPAFLGMAHYYADGLADEKTDMEKALNLAHKAYQEGDESLRKTAAEFLLRNEIERTCIEYQSSHCSSTKLCPKKNILSEYNIKGPKEYLSYDATIFKNGKQGFVITDKGIYFRNMGNKDFNVLEYDDFIATKDIRADKDCVVIDDVFVITYIGDSTEDLAELLRKIRNIARKYLKD